MNWNNEDEQNFSDEGGWKKIIGNNISPIPPTNRVCLGDNTHIEEKAYGVMVIYEIEFVLQNLHCIIKQYRLIQ